MVYQKAIFEARKIIKQFDPKIDHFEFNLEVLCEPFKTYINEISFSNFCLIKNIIAGSVIKISYCGYNNLMTINKDLIYGRKRFTIAHEFGHVILKHLEIKSYWQDKIMPIQKKNYIESEADAFAAELLMPAAKLKHLFFNEKIQNPSELADIFGVSNSAMKIRIKNLFGVG